MTNKEISTLRSDVAVAISIRIMDSFVEMRKYMASASLLHERLNTMEVRQINYQQETEAIVKSLRLLDWVINYTTSRPS